MLFIKIYLCVYVNPLFVLVGICVSNYVFFCVDNFSKVVSLVLGFLEEELFYNL